MGKIQNKDVQRAEFLAKNSSLTDWRRAAHCKTRTRSEIKKEIAKAADDIMYDKQKTRRKTARISIEYYHFAMLHFHLQTG